MYVRQRAYTVIQRAMHIHPTVTELIRPARELKRWSERAQKNCEFARTNLNMSEKPINAHHKRL